MIPIEDTPVRTTKATKKESKCPIHSSEEMRFCCLDCRMMVCGLCVITAHHRDHVISSLEEASGMARQGISNAQSGIK